MDFEPDSIGKSFTSKQIYTDRRGCKYGVRIGLMVLKSTQAIVFPENIEQVKEIISFAIRENVQLVLVEEERVYGGACSI